MSARWLLIGALIATAAAAVEDDPPPELLEFLGSFETGNGLPIDPTQLDVVPPVEAPQVDTEERGPEHD